MSSAMNRLIRRMLALACMLVPAIALADSPTGPAFTELGHDFPGFDAVYRAHLAVADFDHDGKEDLAFAGFAGFSMAYTSIHVVGKDSVGDIRSKQSILIPAGGGPIRLLTFKDASGNPHLLYVEGDGSVMEWSGWPLVHVRTFATIDAPTSAVVGDIDADGIPELVVRNSTTLAAYSMATTAQKWTFPSGGGGELLLAQLDSDPALEIVLGGTSPGRIIDGATMMEDWSYPDSFGSSMAAGNLGSPPARGFVGAADRVTVFSGLPYSPLWDYVEGLYFYVSALDVVDIDGDGVAEIILSTPATMPSRCSTVSPTSLGGPTRQAMTAWTPSRPSASVATQRARSHSRTAAR